MNHTLVDGVMYNQTNLALQGAMGLRVCIVLLISLGIVSGNIVNIVVLYRVKQIPKVTKYIMMNMGASDLLVGTVACIPAIYPAITGTWPYGKVWCQIAGITHGISVTVSIWSVALISVDRYIAVSRPLEYHKYISTKRAVSIIAGFWFCAFITFFAPVASKPDWLYYQFQESEVLCGMYWETPVFCIVTAIYIPILSAIVLAVCSIRMTKAMKEAAIKRAMMVGHKSKSNSFDGKALKIIGLTAGSFFTCWGPYVILATVESFAAQPQLPPEVHFFFVWLANLNSCLNVVIYSTMNSHFKRQLRVLFGCKPTARVVASEATGSTHTQITNE